MDKMVCDYWIFRCRMCGIGVLRGKIYFVCDMKVLIGREGQEDERFSGMGEGGAAGAI